MLSLAIMGESKSDISCELKLYPIITRHSRFIVKYYKNIVKETFLCQLSRQIKGKKTLSRANLCYSIREIEGAKL